MKNFRRFCLVLALIAAFTTTPAWAGEMQTPGAPAPGETQTPPAPGETQGPSFTSSGDTQGPSVAAILFVIQAAL